MILSIIISLLLMALGCYIEWGNYLLSKVKEGSLKVLLRMFGRLLFLMGLANLLYRLLDKTTLF